MNTKLPHRNIGGLFYVTKIYLKLSTKGQMDSSEYEYFWDFSPKAEVYLIISFDVFAGENDFFQIFI